MQYSAHADFVAPARARPEIWRGLLGLLLISVVYLLGILALFGILIATSGFEGANTWMAMMMVGETPTSTLLVLATFVGMGLGPLLAARWLHKRSFGSVFGARKTVIRDFAIAAGVCGILYAAMALLPSPVEPSPNLEMNLWLAFLPLALVGVLIQTGAEEVLFRGYIQQQLAARFASPLVWMVLPSICFALLHYYPDIYGGNAWVVVAAVGLFAILAADLTALTGSIGAAWGLHFTNNVAAILFVAVDGPISGLALYTLPLGDMTAEAVRPLLLLNMAITVGVWLVTRVLLTRAGRS